MTKFRRATARWLRANQTGAEQLLWRELRKLEIEGRHFRRQVPVGRYVVGFACMTSRLVIELDGSHHGEAPNKERDSARTRWLNFEGYRVLRFWNNDLVENLDGVMQTIYAELYGSRDAESRPLRHLQRTKDHPHPVALRAPTLPLQGRVRTQVA
jgi:very-short-patch-repair endonuclease